MSRKIEEIRSGVKHGPINSYVTSNNIASLNPFVLWDHFYAADVSGTAGFGFHGHSGVATISYPQAGDIEHADTGGHTGVLQVGGLQIMSAGEGVLHKETVYPKNKTAEAFQLWVALPELEQEMGPVVYSTAQKNALPVHHAENGTATKIVVGEYAGLESPIRAPVEMTYLHIKLKGNSHWQYTAKPEQTTAFIYVRSGSVEIGEVSLSDMELGIYELTSAPIEIKSLEDDAEFLIVTGAPLKQEIISNGSSVHSSTENLITGVQKINHLQNKKREQS